MFVITDVCLSCPPLAGCRRPAYLLFRRFRRKAQCRWWDENYFMDADGKEWYWSPDRATWIDKDGYDEDGYYEDGSYRWDDWDGYDDGYDDGYGDIDIDDYADKMEGFALWANDRRQDATAPCGGTGCCNHWTSTAVGGRTGLPRRTRLLACLLAAYDTDSFSEPLKALSHRRGTYNFMLQIILVPFFLKFTINIIGIKI